MASRLEEASTVAPFVRHGSQSDDQGALSGAHVRLGGVLRFHLETHDGELWGEIELAF